MKKRNSLITYTGPFDQLFERRAKLASVCYEVEVRAVMVTKIY